MNENITEQKPASRPDIRDVLGLGAGKMASGLSTRQWVLTALGVLVALAAVYMLGGGSRASKATTYITEPAKSADLRVIVTATGSVQPINEVDVSSELSGTIRRVLVDFNTKVKAGQVLAELDTDKLKASVASSRAKLAAAEAKVADAEATLAEKKLDYDRKRSLADRKVTSDFTFQSARAAYRRAVAGLKSAQADVAAAKADLQLQETNLAKACICSPINGIVLNRDVEPGQTVAANLQAPVLFTLAEDLSKMEVRVDVDEADVGQVKEGQNATFTVDAYPDKTFSARIRELRFGSETVSGVVTYKAVLETSNKGLLLRPGMTATAEINVQERLNVLTVPNAALRFAPPVEDEADTRSFVRRLMPGPPRMRRPAATLQAGPNRTIWILEDGKAKAVKVTIGATDGSRTQIVKGDLKTGDRVIVDTANGAS